MFVVLSVAPPEFDRAKQLLEWVRDLDGATPHKLAILGTFYLSVKEMSELRSVAVQSFSEVTMVKQQVAAEGAWPRRGNALFKSTCEWVKNNRKDQGPWLWLECDCVPMRAGWLAAIEKEYRECGKSFMGTVYDRPFPHINGVMVYPHDPLLIARGIFANPAIAWDLAGAKVILANGYNSPLMHRALATPETNTCYTFNRESDLDRIRPEAVLFHGCKDGSLINFLRGRKHLIPDVPKPKPTVLESAVRMVRKLVNGETYYHSGNLGDVIYGLNAIRLAGGGGLTIGRWQNGTSPCSMPITEAQFDKFRPLLDVQPYLKSVAYAAGYPEYIMDLNKFRDDWNNGPLRKKTGINSLCKMHCYTLGVDDKFRDSDMWLSVPGPIHTNRIIIHRSARYHANNFPWADVVKRYGDQLLFVGMPDEHVEFQREFGKVSFWQAKNLLELAQLVVGADAFIGNQSFPCAVALGYGQTVWQEAWFNKSADCMFERENFFTQRNRFEEFEKWL